MRRAVAEVAPLERDALHPREHLVRPKPRFDGERLDRHAQKPRLVRHVATFYTLTPRTRGRRVRRALRLATAGRIVTPRDATGESQGQRVAEDDVGGKLGAERCATIAACELRLPRGARVGEHRAVQRAGEEWPRPDPAFDPPKRKAIVEVHHHCARAVHIACFEPSDE